MTAPDATPRNGENVADEQSDGPNAMKTTLGAEPATLLFPTSPKHGQADVSVSGEWLRDERGSVVLTTRLEDSEVSIIFGPEDARRLAAKITSAASYAKGER